MILRVIRGRGGAAQLEALCGALQASFDRSTGEHAGPTRFHLAARPAGDVADILMLAFWATPELAVGSDARGESPLVIAQRHIDDVVGDAFELSETILRRADEEPLLIRLATGTFSKPGADLETLDLLRQRVPQLGEEMTEAYIARRIVARVIEITFVTAWLDAPQAWRLEEAFWPDIALRYETFDVGVYRTVSLAE